MDIQQKDKESLAAYIHRFKREAKGAISTKMWPLSEYLSKVLRTLTL